MEKYSNHFTKLMIEERNRHLPRSGSRGNGSLRRILLGDPLRAEVAHDEAMRWFYFPPFRKCGQPVEGVVPEEVDFRGP